MLSDLHPGTKKFSGFGACVTLVISSGIWSLGCGSGIVSTPAGTDTVIAKENAKPGDASWVLTNPATQHEIEGYASATSITRGGDYQFLRQHEGPQL